MDDEELAELLKAAFAPYARAFATVAPDRFECDMRCDPDVAAVCTLSYGPRDREILRGRPVEAALESALRALCRWVDGRDVQVRITSQPEADPGGGFSPSAPP